MKTELISFYISGSRLGAGDLNDENAWMLPPLRHCNVRIAAERVLLLLHTMSNAHVIV